MKETPKTAKEVAIECAKRKPKLYYSEPFEPHERVIDAMEEYASIKAEQARREERERHNKIIRVLMDIWVNDMIPAENKRIYSAFKKGGYILNDYQSEKDTVTAAGYE